jgi:DNA-binding NtrC family response regulator
MIVEKEMITRTIEFTARNKTRAAEILGVTTKTLYNKLERFVDKTAEMHQQELL